LRLLLYVVHSVAPTDLVVVAALCGTGVTTSSVEGGEADNPATKLADLLAAVSLQDPKADGSSVPMVTAKDKVSGRPRKETSADSSNYAFAVSGATSSVAAEHCNQLMAEFPDMYHRYQHLQERVDQVVTTQGRTADLAVEVLDFASVVEGLATAAASHAALAWLNGRCSGMVSKVLTSV
jgi:hypothetical protein